METTKKPHNARTSSKPQITAEAVPLVIGFTQNAEKHPNRPALVAQGRTLSYQELNSAANRLAHKILALRSEREEPVAFLSGLEIDSIVFMLGIWKAAKFFVALDPENSPERLNGILGDIETPLLVTNLNNLPLARQLSQAGMEILVIEELDPTLSEENPAVPISPDALSAVYYTSGSTGKPKGVMQRQRATAPKSVDSVSSLAGDRVLLPFKPAFAWAYGRVAMAFHQGKALYLLDYNSMTMGDVATWLIENKITSIAMTSSMFSQFLASLPNGLPKFPHMRLVNVGGEAFNPQDLELWKANFSPPCQLSTSLASSEGGSIARVTYDFESKPEDVQGGVGRPEPGVKIFILDQNGRPLNAGEVGRIAVRSDSVTAGYWRQPDLNKKLFTPDPENPREQILVSSDLGRLREDGTLEFMGRSDAMLKIRGFRVEPGEIETALRKHPAIQNAAVTGQRPSNTPEEIALVAYIVPKPAKALDASSLRGFLAKQLPHYMVPSYYLFMNALPLTHNGKVDRNKLPEPDWASSNSEDYLAPQTELQTYLTQLWEKVLGKEHVGITDDFFMLGGHSLAAFRIMAEIQKTHGVKLPLQILIAYSTIEVLASAIETSKQEAFTPSSLTAVREPSGGPSLFMVPGVARTSVALKKLAESIDASIGIYGLEYPGMDGYLEPIDDTQQLAAFFAQQILAIQPLGPYWLAGQCYGGVIAFETARQLSAMGHEIDLVILLDSSPPGMRDNELDGREPTYYLKRLAIMLKKENRANFFSFVAGRLRRISRTKAHRKPAPQEKQNQPEDLPQMSWTENRLDQASLRVAYATSRARNTYTPKKLDARGLVIMSSMARGSAREAWWGRLFDELECHYLPGTTHSNIFSSEHSRKTIGALVSKAVTGAANKI